MGLFGFVLGVLAMANVGLFPAWEGVFAGVSVCRIRAEAVID